MNYFCTYFDINFLLQGMALYRSLKEHCSEFRLWVLCMDRDCYDGLSHMSVPEMELIALDDFERGDHALLRAKQDRSRIEYYFTCTPSLPLYVLNNFPEVNLITYVDADLYFYADPRPIYEEIGDHSIAIIEHRYSPQLKHLMSRGIYNVGWLSFRRDENGFACLNWWRDRCNEWCYRRPEDGKFADQKYLDGWPTRFSNLRVLQHKGANLAPWNIANYKISIERNKLWVDDHELIFFHFHGFMRLTETIYGTGFYKVKTKKTVRDNIYKPYLQCLLSLSSELELKAVHNPQLKEGRVRSHVSLNGNAYSKIRHYLKVIYRVIILGNYVAVPNCFMDRLLGKARIDK